jgi:DNA modification methylase
VKWPAAVVEIWPIDKPKPRTKNPRTHSAEQIEQVAASMREWGWTNPLLVDEDGVLIAGHCRLMAGQKNGYQEAPVMVARGWSAEQIRAYVIADNKLALNAGWDESLLVAELEALSEADFQMELIGFSDEELKALTAEPEPEPDNDGRDNVPEQQAQAITAVGEVWMCGRHRVMCGDSTIPDQVAILMNGEKARVLHADPPYGMGKEDVGVLNDNLYGDKLDRFQMAWWYAWRPFLEPNASAYIWGNAPNLWRLWYRTNPNGAGIGGLDQSEPLTLRNEIVWDKKSIAGMASEDLTQYPEASERCLFFQVGRHVLLVNQTKDDYWDGWEPIRRWLCEERNKAGWKPGDVKRICENHMYGHWFGKSQWVFISRENYEKLQRAAAGKAFVRDYADLDREYRTAAKVFNGEVRDPRVAEFKAGRPYFDNAHSVMRDVWEFSRVSGEERHDHATPKPVDMMERVMRSSLRDGELAVEPFIGSGSTLIGAHKSQRRCFGMELDPRWVDVTVRRWQSYSGLKATLEGDGRTFDEVERERTKAKAVVHAGT